MSLVRTGLVGTAVALALTSAIAGNLVANGGFEDGLSGWQAAGPPGTVSVTAEDPYEGHSALRLDATAASHEAGAVSNLVAVAPGRPYRLSAWVKQTTGYGAYKVVVEWLSADDRHIAYSNDWMGYDCPSTYREHGGIFMAPTNAAQARLLIGVSAGSACRMDAIALTPLPPEPPHLNAYVFCSPPDRLDNWEVSVRVQSTGGQPTRDVRAILQCPKGTSAQDPARAAGDIIPGGTWHAEWQVAGTPVEADGSVEVQVSAANSRPVRAATRLFTTVGRIETARTRGAPAPRPVETDALVGAYYFPVMLDWERAGWGVRHVDYLSPLLGYYNEALPQVADWHIKWAVEHGIRFLAFDWYYSDGSKYLQDALEKGFLRSRYRPPMKFCVNWCNEGQCTWDRPECYSTESLQRFMEYLCEHYFVYPEYLRVNGAPVVMIIRPDPIIEWHGGPDGSRKALQAMRDVARSHGYGDLYLMCIGSAARSELYRRAGYDGITAYSYGWANAPRYPNGDAEYEDLLPEHERLWEWSRREARAGGLGYMPVVWTGWDDTARAHERAVRTRGNTPERFRRMLEGAARSIDPSLNMVIVEAWNEWGEGGYLEPSRERGFSFLDAVRDVFSDRRGPHVDIAPSEEQVARYGTHRTFEEIDADYVCRDREERGVRGVTDLDWQFGRPSDREAWFTLHQLRPEPLAEQALCLRSTGPDPAMVGPMMMEVDAGRYTAIEIRMAVDRGADAQVFWLADGQAAFTDAASLHFPLVADRQLHDYRVPCSSLPTWRGLIRRVRLDPTDVEGAAVRVAYIRGVVP